MDSINHRSKNIEHKSALKLNDKLEHLGLYKNESIDSHRKMTHTVRNKSIDSHMKMAHRNNLRHPKSVHDKIKDFQLQTVAHRNNLRHHKNVHDKIKEFQLQTVSNSEHISHSLNKVNIENTQKKHKGVNVTTSILSHKMKGYKCTKCEYGKRTFVSLKILEEHTKVAHKKKNRKFIRPVATDNFIFKNYSSFEFNDATKQLFEKGRSFIPTHGVNKTNVLVKLNELERKIRLKWHFYLEDKKAGVEDLAEHIIPLPIKTKKKVINLSKLNQPPQPIKSFIANIRGSILTGNYKRIYSNLPPEERESLKELIDLQKSGKIVVTRCDKTGSLAILNRSQYIEGINKLLNIKMKDYRGNEVEGYTKSNMNVVKIHFESIIKLIDKGATMGLFNNEIAKALKPTEAKPGKLYGLLKDHKPIPDNETIPPMRPVVSGCESNTEKISSFLDYYIKPLVKNLSSYLEDTTDFLNFLEQMKSDVIPKDVIPVSIDVVALYSSIPHEDAIRAVRKALNTRTNDAKETMPTCYLIEILEMILKFNTFEFNGDIYQQEFGISMGTISAPSIANLDMGRREVFILDHDNEHIKRIYKRKWSRFIDDIFIFFQGNKEQLNDMMTWLNSLFPTIKFTCSYNFEDRSVEFLDVRVKIHDNGTISTDLYKKNMAINKYLKPTSFHPKHITNNIPYNVGLRIRRICSEEKDFKNRIGELKNLLKERNYNSKVVEQALEKLKNVDRIELLKKKSKSDINSNEHINFVFPFNPQIPNPKIILNRCIKELYKDSESKKAFGGGFRVAYEKGKNIERLLCRASLWPIEINNPVVNVGWHPCNKCIGCRHSLQETDKIKFHHKNVIFEIKSRITCVKTNFIYAIECTKCKLQSVGSSITTFRQRSSGWRSDIKINKKEDKVISHFNTTNHSLDKHFRMTPFELVFGNEDVLRTRETMYINKFDLIENGLNTKRT